VKALIDADIVAWRAAGSLKEDDPTDLAFYRTDRIMEDLLHEVGTDEYEAFLSGSTNFRYDLYPAYKANRDRPRPPSLQPTREYLVTTWNAVVCDGIEADDALGKAQEATTIICSIDKDLLQIPGFHYNFVKKEFQTVSLEDSYRNFYKQCLLGDRSDNVPGFDGMARQKPTKLIQSWFNELDSMSDPIEMFEFVRERFVDDNNLLLTGRLLYIQRSDNDMWKFPTDGL